MLHAGMVMPFSLTQYAVEFTQYLRMKRNGWKLEETPDYLKDENKWEIFKKKEMEQEEALFKKKYLEQQLRQQEPMERPGSASMFQQVLPQLSTSNIKQSGQTGALPGLLGTAIGGSQLAGMTITPNQNKMSTTVDFSRVSDPSLREHLRKYLGKKSKK